MQNNAAASLVRNSAPPFYANQHQPSEDPAHTDSDVQLHKPPTLWQEEALHQLRVFDKSKILAWLTILRCIEPGFRYCARGGYLSSQQVEALSTLTDCDDRDILAWLDLNILACDVDRQPRPISVPKTLYLSSHSHRQRSSTNPSPRSSVSSFAPSAVFSTESSCGTPRSSLGYGTPLPELSEEIANTGESTHAHWCTYGEHPKPTYTCEGWKRHEREHEVPYLCMPNGPVEYTQHGMRCVLCGKDDPNEEHLSRHNVSFCVGRFGEPLKKSRKTDMVIHLAKHRVHSKDAAALADKWRYALNKKNFSCGLCIKHFSSITERSNHIDNVHWRRGQTMDAWELSNCIRGLLLERKVQAAWGFLLRSHPNVVEANLCWEMPLAEGLQLRLEKGEENPLVLAKAALQLSNYGQLRPTQEELEGKTGREQMTFVPIPAALSKSTYQSLPDHTQLHASMTQHLPRSLSSSNTASFSTDLQDSDCDSSLISSVAFEDSLQPDGVYPDALLHATPLADQSIGDISSQSSTHAWSTEWLPMDTSQPLDDNTRIKDHLSQTGALLMAQMSSPRREQSTAYAGLSAQGPMLESPADVPTPSTLLLPTSAFSYGSAAQLPIHEYDIDLRNKPLPPEPSLILPRDANRTLGCRPTTPMDFTTG